MTDRTCPKCQKIFDFPSVLRKHVQNSFHCLMPDEDIDKYISDNKKIPITYVEYKCSKCERTFGYKHTYMRHIETTKCGKSQIVEGQENGINLPNKITDKKLKQIINDRANQLATRIINNDENHHNINHNEQIVNNTLNINNTNSNNTIIQHIYPLGFERLPSIPPDRMKRLLTLGDRGVIDIVKLVCEQDENKNFYKLNMNKSNISYLSPEYKIDVCQENELKEKLLKKCVMLTYQMLIACESILSTSEIDHINSNLQSVSRRMKEEIFDYGLKNIIECELRTNSKQTKERIFKYAEVLNSNPHIIDQEKDKCKSITAKEQANNEKLKPYFTIRRLNRRLGDPVEYSEFTKAITYDDFNLNRFEYTKYYNYWIKRIEDEARYSLRHEKKTMGDSMAYEHRKKSIMECMAYMEDISGKMMMKNDKGEYIITRETMEVKIPECYKYENYKKMTSPHRLFEAESDLTEDERDVARLEDLEDFEEEEQTIEV